LAFINSAFPHTGKQKQAKKGANDSLVLKYNIGIGMRGKGCLPSPLLAKKSYFSQKSAAKRKFMCFRLFPDILYKIGNECS